MNAPNQIASTGISTGISPGTSLCAEAHQNGPDRNGSTPAGLPRRARRASGARLVLGAVALMAISSCASMSIKRDTETSGTFSSSGRSFTILSWEIPRAATQIAHENIADTGLPNVQATRVRSTDWGWFDWLLEIISVRSARVSGTWGYRDADLPVELRNQ